MSTRLDIKKRWELLTARSKFLENELTTIEKELDILKELKTLYNSTSEDPIDDAWDNKHLVDKEPTPQVTQHFTEKILKKNAQNGNSDKIFSLISTGPTTYNELLAASGLAKGQLSDGLHTLKKKRAIIKEGLVYRVTTESDSWPDDET